MKLVEKLNLYSVDASNCGDNRDTGKPEYSLDADPEDQTLFDDDGVVTDEDFNTFLDELDTLVVRVEDHPVDRRAGLVHTVTGNNETAWYDATSECCWVEG